MPPRRRRVANIQNRANEPEGVPEPQAPPRPAENMNEAMFRAFRDMFDRVRGEPPVRDARREHFREFQRLQVPTFKGEGTPQEADDWFQALVKHLDTIQTPPENRVEFATYKLEGRAGTWWNYVRRAHDVATMGWEQFERLFYDRFFPQSYQDRKAQEFLELQQGNMTVFEYEAKFSDLARFAPSVVATEHMRCLKFENGLKPSIRRQLVAHEIREYTRLVSAALRVEEDNLAFQKDKSTKTETSGGPIRNPRRNQGRETQSQLVNVRPGPYNPICHQCHQPGHIKRNYPMRLQSPMQPSQSQQSVQFSSGCGQQSYQPLAP